MSTLRYGKEISCHLVSESCVRGEEGRDFVSREFLPDNNSCTDGLLYTLDIISVLFPNIVFLIIEKQSLLCYIARRNKYLSVRRTQGMVY